MLSRDMQEAKDKHRLPAKQLEAIVAGLLELRLRKQGVLPGDVWGINQLLAATW